MRPFQGIPYLFTIPRRRDLFDGIDSRFPGATVHASLELTLFRFPTRDA